MEDQRAINAAARSYLANHVSKPVAAGWDYGAKVAIQTICRTFEACPAESEKALRSLLAPDRMDQFPASELGSLADNLPLLGNQADELIIDFFREAFAREVLDDGQTTHGGRILPLHFRSADLWNHVHYQLAQYCQSRTDAPPEFLTKVVCHAWNGRTHRIRRHSASPPERPVLATVPFRGRQCELIEDWSHISYFGDEEEATILSIFRNRVNQWAEAADRASLDIVLDQVAALNRTALLWKVLFEIGSDSPNGLGALLQPFLAEPVCLWQSDYASGARKLFGALHRSGDPDRRGWLETQILTLPERIPDPDAGFRDDGSSLANHTMDRLLGLLREEDLVLPEAIHLYRRRQAVGAVQAAHDGSVADLFPRRGGWRVREEPEDGNLDPTPRHLAGLQEKLKVFLAEGERFKEEEVEANWSLLAECEQAVTAHSETHPETAQELWGHLVGAANHLAGHAHWPPESDRWKAVRSILLQAVADTNPDHPRDAATDGWIHEGNEVPSWGWPAPRLDAAQGLVWLLHRLQTRDDEILTALRQLRLDPVSTVRYNLLRDLFVLHRHTPDLFWEFVDHFVATSRRFSEMELLIPGLDHFWETDPESVRARLRIIGDRIGNSNPTHSVHRRLANAYLFHFLRTGDLECREVIWNLIERCETEPACSSLSHQLGPCRSGHWLTAGDAVRADPEMDALRERTWEFFGNLLRVAQAKWSTLRQRPLPSSGCEESPAELTRVTLLVKHLVTQLYFASGAYAATVKDREDDRLSPAQQRRFWREASPLFEIATHNPHPSIVHELLRTLDHLLPCAPADIFLLACRAIQFSAQEAHFQSEPMAHQVVVRLVERTLADHRDIFRRTPESESECVTALVTVLDLFASWDQARRLTLRLEEIYR